MSDELYSWLCLGPVVVLYLIPVVVGLHCWYVLERKSLRSFLWSIDWADVLLRLEREFRITFYPDDFRHLEKQQPPDITAGELFAIMRRKVWDTGHPAPADGWQRLTGALSEALNVPASSILCESRLRADLAME
jgi:hypothetical protein